MSVDFLAAMAASSRARAVAARASVPFAALERRCADLEPPPRLHLSGEFDVIAEIKPRSPAAGQLADHVNPAERARAYVKGGAAAVSVLTEPDQFGGGLEHLRQAAAALTAFGAPAMRKDFIVDPYQILEARAVGAGGVLLILKLCSDGCLREMFDCAAALGLFVLLEAFDEADIERARLHVEDRVETILVGLNCRDLTSLKCDPARFFAYANLLPARAPRVAESGVENAADAAKLAFAGYEIALVGGALMRAADPARLIASLIAAGRAGA